MTSFRLLTAVVLFAGTAAMAGCSRPDTVTKTTTTEQTTIVKPAPATTSTTTTTTRQINQGQ